MKKTYNQNNRHAAKPAEARADAVIKFRCTPADKARWLQAAGAQGVTLTEYIKRALDNLASNTLFK